MEDGVGHVYFLLCERGWPMYGFVQADSFRTVRRERKDCMVRANSALRSMSRVV